MEGPALKPLKDCRVAIVGLGLMGGSMALDLRGQCAERVGVARSPETLDLALARGMVDRLDDFDPAVEQCDLIVLATPPRTILAQLRALAERPPAGAATKVVVDLGSTKAEIVAAMEALPGHFEPVGGHPMCGKETSGAAAAEAGLYRGQTFVLVPLARTSAEAFSLVRELATTLGGRPLVLSAAQHDALVAATSHLPYLAAVALVQAAAATGDERVWEMAASGFRDTSRLAASDLTMMVDILLTNRAAVLAALNAFCAQTGRLAALIERGDADALRTALAPAQSRRASLFKKN